MRTNAVINLRNIIIIVLLATLLASDVFISSADSSVPPIPNTFSGTVKFVNSSGQFDAPAGTLIEALIDNITKGANVTVGNRYNIDVYGTNGDDGKDIILKANNLTAEQRPVFNASSPPPQTLNLIVNLTEQTDVPSSLSIVINNGNEYTNSTAVILGLSAVNADQMSFSNDSVSWSAWESYTTTKSWSLTNGDSLKTVYFKAKNSAGEASPVNSTITLDTTPPIVQITNPANGTIVGTSNINFTGTATDSSRIKGGSYEQQSEMVGGGGGLGIINSTFIAFAYNLSLQEGKNFIKITYIDVANNSGSASVNVTLDTTPPGSITNLVNMSYTGTYINWTWTDPADTDFSKVMVYVDGILKTNVSKGVQSYSAIGFSPGTQHTIATRTVDTIGNINQTWVNNTARTKPDSTLPASITNLTNTSYAQKYINWTWTDPKDSDFKWVKVYIDGKFKTNVTKGKQFYNATNLTINAAHTISTHTEDTSGNINQTWVNHTARTAPLPSSLSIVINNGNEYTNSTAVILSLSATNAEQMSFSNDNISWNSWETFSITKLWTLTSGDGLKTVYFRARNSAGEAQPVNDTITLDTTPPEITVIKPLSDEIVGNTTITIKANLSDTLSGINVSTVELFINATKHNEMAVEQAGLNATLIETLDLSEGIHNITIRAKDNVTNLKEIGWNFTIAIPPSITSQTPAPGSFVNSSSIIISANLRDNESGINAIATKMFLDGSDETANATKTNVLISLVKQNLSDGKHTVAIETFDNKSNKATYSWDFIVDATAPEVNISDPIQNETLKYFENIVKGTFKDDNIQSATLTVKNETTSWLREYSLNLTPDGSGYKFIERVEFANDRNNVIELLALDKAGNTNVTAVTVLVKNNTYVNETNVTKGNATIIDAKNESDTEIEFIPNITTNVTFTVTATTNETMVENVTNSSSKFGEVALGKIVEVNVTGLNATNKSEVQSVTIKLFYTKEDLDAKGLDENKLFVYWYDAGNGNWTKLLKGSPEWVLDNGTVKITDSNPGYVWVKVEHLSIFALVGSSYSTPETTPTPTSTTPAPPSGGGSGGGSSGGGGGSGGTSGENYTNIEVKEKYSLYIYKDKVTSYAFTNRSNPILFINITGNTNAGEITTMVEILKGTSTLVNSSAPGVVYKNVNIWVGTSGFASLRNIKESTITFMVENSWLDKNNLARNDIGLVKWDGSNWKKLETSEKMRNDNYTYFEAKTSSFSPFAITGLKSGVISSVTPEITKTVTNTPAVTQSPSEEAPPISLSIIIGMLFLIAIAMVVYLKRKNSIKK